LNKLWKDEGSFTIEASLLLPIIMFITMLLLFFCLYSYQKSMLLQVGSLTTERGAYNWDNSYKGKTGSFTAGQSDSLYWRIGEDNMLGSLFGTGTESGNIAVQLPDENEGMTGDLPVVKLGHSAVSVPENLPGAIKYTFGLSGRKVSIKLRHLLDLPGLQNVLSDGGTPEVEVQSLITEPVEFIRTVDLMRYYGAKFQGVSTNEEPGTVMKQSDASEMIGKLKSK